VPSTCGTRTTSAPSDSSIRTGWRLLPADIVTTRDDQGTRRRQQVQRPYFRWSFRRQALLASGVRRHVRIDNGPSGPILDAAARLQKFCLRKYTAGAFQRFRNSTMGVRPIRSRALMAVLHWLAYLRV
jgi:hypothetical protein